LAVGEIVRLLLATVLAGSAVAKLAAGGEARDALRSFGIRGARLRAGVWSAIVAAELVLAAALVLAVPGAAAAAAALLGLYAAALAVALARGRDGAPCGCFGRRSRIGRLAVLRAAALAAAAAASPWLPDAHPSTTAWLAAGLATALLGITVLGAAVLALARELGEVRLALGPQAALSLAGEGPEPGSRVTVIDRFEPGARLALAVFSSPSCRLCQGLEPAIRLVGREPGVSLAVFDEQRDADVWHALGIPGSPFAVVMAGDGTVLATGTFNTLAQLEGLLAAAEREVAAVAGV
jgi:hypothetical protein